MKKTSDYRPIVVLPCIMSKNSISFLDSTQKIKIRGKWVKLIKKVLKYCNGNYSVCDISKITGIKKKTLGEVIKGLEKYNVVVDSREQYKHFHRISNYPTSFSKKLSQEEITKHKNTTPEIYSSGEKLKGQTISLYISELLKDRSSCREYLDMPLTLDHIQSLCYIGYGKIRSSRRYSVASGGGLYPLKLYVIINRDQINIPAGYYEYNPNEDCLVRFNSVVDMEQLKYCFNSEDFYGSSVQIVIAGDLDRQGYKYANRSYRLCLIEVGHVAENIILASIEMGFGSCEMGGLLDDAIHDELKMPNNIVPLLALTVGYQKTNGTNEKPNYSHFIETNVGNDCPIKTSHVWCDDGGFYTAIAEYEDNGQICVGGATARSDIFAQYKAVIEAYERYESFVGKTHKRMKNSCGIAAHFDVIEAQKAALAELIERDAIMRCWNEKTPPAVIKNPSIHVQRRREFWNECGRELSVLLLKTEYAPVVLITIIGEEYPFFVCGAASSVGKKGEQKNEFEKLQNKALLEAESSLLFYIKHPEHEKAPRVEDIHAPEQHGQLYRMDKRALKHISWLTKGEPYQDKIVWRYSFEELMCILHAEPTVLNYLENGLVVLRMSSPDLIEMKFGKKESEKFPHFFA